MPTEVHEIVDLMFLELRSGSRKGLLAMANISTATSAFVSYQLSAFSSKEGKVNPAE